MGSDASYLDGFVSMRPLIPKANLLVFGVLRFFCALRSHCGHRQWGRGVKKAGPSFRKRARALKGCDTCQETGTIKGIFHEMDCYDCGTAGLVDKETGEALPDAEAKLQLRLEIRRLREENNELRRQLLEQAKQDNGRGYGPGGQKYHGD